MDAGGVEAARPWVERAGTTFPTVVDAENQLALSYDFRAIPNGICLDADRIVRYRKLGGFSCEHDDDRTAVTRLLRGEALPASAESTVGPPDENAALRRELIETAWRLGLELRKGGAIEEAAAAWRRALRYDPDNFVIRKQIWALLHPERFREPIDYAWQQEQLARERAAESAACGPAGCVLPPTLAEPSRYT